MLEVGDRASKATGMSRNLDSGKREPGTRFGGVRRAGVLLGWLIAASLPSVGVAEPYEVIRGTKLRLCQEMAKNMNEFKGEPPMVCERKFDPKYEDFWKPNWQPLPPEQALEAALAIRRARWKRHPKAVAEQEKEIRQAAAERKLRAWEARFDIARNGEQPRVVMVSSGECRLDLRYTSEFDPEVAVFRGHTFELDERYERLWLSGTDVFFFQAVPYLASWSNYPGAIGRDPAPPKHHRGYVFVWETFWLRAGFGAHHDGGTAGQKGPICQIGYERLSQTKPKVGGSK